MQEYPRFPNLAAMMLALARAWPNRRMLRHFRDGGWHSVTWGEFGRRTASAAFRLREMGVSAGDRVVIVADNRPDYLIAEAALMAIRAVPVPTYTTNTIADHAHVLRDCGARAAIVGNPAQRAALAEAAAIADGLDLLLVMDSPEWAADHRRKRLRSMTLAAEADLIPGGALACLIYTSGTGGAPKGVMLPHRAILSNCAGAFELLRTLPIGDDIYLSFLPLSHSYEHTVGQYFLPSIGAEIVYCRGVEHLAADMAAIRPTIMTVVPRVLEVIRGRVLAQIARAPAWRRKLFDYALQSGLRRLDGGRRSLLGRAMDPLLDRLVRRQVRDRFGGRLKGVMSGGARLEPEVGRFFLALGIPVLQGYGQTEAGPVIAANPPHAIRIDTVGPPLRGVELRIADDGEILVRGDLVMAGYWGQPEATAAAIEDGWLHTGDIGVLEADGYLRITDRKKDMIVLSGGENVSPARVEGMLVAEPEIAQAVVLGDGKPALSALPGGGGGQRRGCRRACRGAGERAAVSDGTRAPPPAGGTVHPDQRAADANAEGTAAGGDGAVRRAGWRPGGRPEARISPRFLLTFPGWHTATDQTGDTAMPSRPKLALFTLAATVAYLGLAVLGWGGFAAFFSHPALTVVAIATLLMVGAGLFTEGNLSSGEREDRANRWVIAALGVIGLLAGYLPAYTDRIGFWTLDGDMIRWLGVVLFIAGGVLRIWPVFVLGRRFSGLVAIQPGHRLVTTGVYGVIRHPSYLGLLVNSLGWALAFRSGVGVLLTALVIPPLLARIGAEERLLRTEFGAEYDAYRSRTSRLIPGLY